MADRTSTVTTWALARVLPGGATTWAPVVAPELCAFGDDDEAPEELKVFLSEHLATVAAPQAARYFVPAGLEVRTVRARLAVGADTKPRSPRPVDVTCVVVPYGPEGRDRFVLVPALGAACFVDRRESIDEVAAREIERLCAASGLDGDDWRRLLPPLEATVEPLEVVVRFRAATATTEDRVKAEERRRAEALLDRYAVAMAARVRGGGVAVVGRDRELASMTALLGGRERLAVLLCGEEGVGKTALVTAWARANPQRLAWATSVAQLVAGASGFGEAERRVAEVFGAAERLDAVLYFEDFGSLFRERVEEGGLALTALVRRFVVEGRVRLIAEITPSGLERAERREIALVGAMTRLPVPVMTPAATLEVVTACAAHWRRASTFRWMPPRRPVDGAVRARLLSKRACAARLCSCSPSSARPVAPRRRSPSRPRRRRHRRRPPASRSRRRPS